MNRNDETTAINDKYNKSKSILDKWQVKEVIF